VQLAEHGQKNERKTIREISKWMRNGLPGLEAGSLANGLSYDEYRDDLRSKKNGAEDLRAVIGDG
jgi:hypothetical protein